MGLMNKLKNLFTEEVEEEIEEPIKKEMVKVEIPSPPVKEEIVPKVEEKEEIVEKPKEEEYKFPFFDDEDFHALEKKEEKPKEEPRRSSYQRKPQKEEKKETYTSPVYNPHKEEKKAFKPTPIISPVYGILDKNYNKEDIRSKGTKLRSYYDPKEATVDEIRNKAYGTLEDDIETTLFGREFEEPEEIKEEREEIIREEMKEKPRHGSDDLTDLLEAELTKEDPKEEPIKEEVEEKPRKISDSELFDMIDSMYQKGDKE